MVTFWMPEVGFGVLAKNLAGIADEVRLVQQGVATRRHGNNRSWDDVDLTFPGELLVSTEVCICFSSDLSKAIVLRDPASQVVFGQDSE